MAGLQKKACLCTHRRARAHTHTHMQSRATSTDKEAAFTAIMAGDPLGHSGGAGERVQEFSFKISAALPGIVTNRIRIPRGGSRRLLSDTATPPTPPLRHIHTRARTRRTHTRPGKKRCAPRVRRSEAASALDWLRLGVRRSVCVPPRPPQSPQAVFQNQVDSSVISFLCRSFFFGFFFLSVFTKAVEPSPPRA